MAIGSKHCLSCLDISQAIGGVISTGTRSFGASEVEPILSETDEDNINKN